ncbi:hypothetical protein [Saccharopolyspora shandongensis]|uniref:hypothetical protein n=1 Tax=Saccharopolyspora shandongensis TaxID=418495 RepID=UPI0015A651DF|nr:hypothetical protein [Saccharopolyspora shandongensis]
MRSAWASATANLAGAREVIGANSPPAGELPVQPCHVTRQVIDHSAVTSAPG